MERPGKGRIEQIKQLDTLDFTLSAIKRVGENPVTQYHRLHQEHMQRLGGMLLDALPGGITDLDLGNDVQVSRRPEQRDNRQTWNLQQVDQYAENMARNLGKEHTPKFQRKGN